MRCYVFFFYLLVFFLEADRAQACTRVRTRVLYNLGEKLRSK